MLIIAAVVGLLCVVLLGVVGSVAIPSFLKNRYKSRQAEVQYTLRVLLTKEQEFQRDRGAWASAPRELVEYVMSAPRNCTCFLGPGAPWGGKGDVKFAQLPPSVRERLQANKPDGGDFVIACAVNLDEDDAPDVWTISSSDPNPRIDFADLGE